MHEIEFELGRRLQIDKEYFELPDTNVNVTFDHLISAGEKHPITAIFVACVNAGVDWRRRYVEVD